MSSSVPMTPIRTRSRPTSTRGRSSTQNSRPDGLHRLYSRGFDDHYHYDHADEGFAGDVDGSESESEHEQHHIAEGSGENTRVNSQEKNKHGEDSSDRESYEEEEEEVEEVPEVRMGIPDQRDIEARPKITKTKSRASSRSRDPNLVGWNGPDDPENPKNWKMGRKWAATFVVSSFTFISPVSSSMVAPALPGAMSRDLGITNEFEQGLVLSIFVLAYAIGPLFLGPLSEVYGRVRVLQLSNLFYLCWNLGCGFAQNSGQMLAFRFMSGLGGSAPLAIGGGLLSDVWSAEQRGKAISIYSLAPLLGPAVGPIAGGFIAANTSWRWVFYATTIVDFAIQISGLFFLQETYAPVLLKRKAQKLRDETGNQALHTEAESPDKTLSKVLRTAMVRPFRLLGTQVIIQFIAVYMAYLYGTMYLILSTFPGLWSGVYHESVSIGGLNYISLGLGFFLGTQITAPINDRIYMRLKKKNNGVGRPEFRVPLMFVGSALIPVGLFWYGWSAQARIHWIMPNIGAAIFGAGAIICFQCMQTYIVDSYVRYAASGVAAAVVLRSLAGFGFPLFAPAMYNALGYGWGNSVLGFASIVIGLPAPALFWFYGEKLRARSTYAAGG